MSSQVKTTARVSATVTAIVAIALVAMVGAPQAGASAQPLRPANVLHQIVLTTGGDGMNAYSGTLAPKSLRVKGRCPKHNRYTLLTKSFVLSNHRIAEISCNGGRYVDPRPELSDQNLKKLKKHLDRVGKSTAASLDLAPSNVTYGAAKLATATNRKARVVFELDSTHASPGAKSIRRIILRRKGTPSVTYYGGESSLLTPALSVEEDANSTVDAVKTTCVKAGLELPRVTRAFLYDPGRIAQRIGITLKYKAMPAECEGAFKRLGQTKIKLQMGADPKHWLLIAPWWDYQYVAQTKGQLTPNVESGSHDPADDYVCRKGPKTTKAILMYQNKVKDLVTGKVVGRSPVRTRAIKIQGGGC